MTPGPEQPRTSHSGFVTGLAVGLAITALLLCLGSGVGYALVRKKGADARRGWNLVPVVVAAVDLKEGTIVTLDEVSQRAIPEQFVTASVIKPDSASAVLNHRILVSAQAGDPLLWSQFDTSKHPQVLFAAHDLALGAALTLQDTTLGDVPEALLTPSWVHLEDRPEAIGRTVSAPFRKGDPILWTHLEQAAAKSPP